MQRLSDWLKVPLRGDLNLGWLDSRNHILLTAKLFRACKRQFLAPLLLSGELSFD